MRLDNKVAIVTGAGTGIGEAIARRLAAEGASVHVTGRHRDNTNRVAEEIRQSGGNAMAHQLDVADSQAIADVFRDAVGISGRLDIMVANAALAGSHAYLGPLLNVSDEQWESIIRVNLSGVFYCAREAARVMIPQGSGCMITLGSVDSFVPEPDVPAYAAAKGGVLMLTKSLARDLGPYGIRVNGIAPGGTDTPHMLATIHDRGLTSAELVAGIPLGRRAAASEIAAVAAFLASDEASYVTGQMVAVDGGWLCT